MGVAAKNGTKKILISNVGLENKAWRVEKSFLAWEKANIGAKIDAKEARNARAWIETASSSIRGEKTQSLVTSDSKDAIGK